MNTGDRSNRKGTWDKEGFYAWWGGVEDGVVKSSETPVEENIEDERETPVEEIEEATDEIIVVNEEQKDLREQIQAFADNCEANPVDYIRPRHIVIEEDEACRDSKKTYVPHGGVYEIPPLVVNHNAHTIVPERGQMTFKGNIDDILRTISKLLDGQNVTLDVQWGVHVQK